MPAKKTIGPIMAVICANGFRVKFKTGNSLFLAKGLLGMSTKIQPQTCKTDGDMREHSEKLLYYIVGVMINTVRLCIFTDVSTYPGHP